MGACRCACLGMTAVTETEMDLAVKRVCCLRDQELGTTGPDTLAIQVLNPVSESEGSICQCRAASLPVERWCWRVAAAGHPGHPFFMLKLAQTRSPLLARLLTEMARLHLRACATSRILPAGEVTKLAATSGQYLVCLSPPPSACHLLRQSTARSLGLLSPAQSGPFTFPDTTGSQSRPIMDAMSGHCNRLAVLGR